MSDLEKTDYSADYINSHRTVLSGIFNYAIRNRLYDTNPVTLVPQMKTRWRNRLVSVEEFPALTRACKGDPELDALVTLGGMTTMRKGEILPRRWDEVHLEGEHSYIEIPLTKNDDPRIVPLPAIAVEALKRLPSYDQGRVSLLGKADSPLQRS